MRRRLITTELAAALLLAAALPAPSALAAPFCLQTQAVPPQCLYFDANTCRQEAAHQRGVCVVNPEEVSVTPGGGDYCLVTSTGASSCVFQDINACAREAVHQGGVCVDAPPRAAGNTPNPYQPAGPGDQANQAPPNHRVCLPASKWTCALKQRRGRQPRCTAMSIAPLRRGAVTVTFQATRHGSQGSRFWRGIGADVHHHVSDQAGPPNARNQCLVSHF